MTKAKEVADVPGVQIRYTEAGDAKYLRAWFNDPNVASYFPMFDQAEMDDAVNRWIGFYRYKCSLTAVKDGTPVGVATLYLQPYRKLAHQCEFGIVVAPECRDQGVGSQLLHHMMHLAKEKFKIELLHLQVYESNPAVRLYRRFGFKDFGLQRGWIKEKDGTYTSRLLMEVYL